MPKLVIKVRTVCIVANLYDVILYSKRVTKIYTHIMMLNFTTQLLMSLPLNKGVHSLFAEVVLPDVPQSCLQ